MLNLVIVSDYFASLTKEQVMYYSLAIGGVVGAIVIGIFGFQNLLMLGAIVLVVKWAIGKRKNE